MGGLAMIRRAALMPLALAPLLGACAADHAPPPPPAAVRATAPPGGQWVVTDVFGVGPSSPGSDRLVGQMLRLDAAQATDALGRSCSEPLWRASQATEADFLGAPTTAQAFPELARTVKVLELICGTESFGGFAEWRDGSLLTRSGPGVLRLERAEAVAARAAAKTMAAVPAPTPEHMPEHAPEHASGHAAEHHHPAEPAAAEPAAKEMAKEAGPAKLVYLASYGSEATAQRGWKTLAAKSPLLAGLQPATTSVDIPGKGHFIRLFAKAEDAPQAAKLCAELKGEIADCGAERK